MKKRGYLLSAALIPITLGTFILLFGPKFIINQIHQRLVLEEGSESYLLWKNLPVPVYNKFYFFNVTNAREIDARGAKPILKEIGPFTYQVLLKKHNINKGINNTINFNEIRAWIFKRELSYADEDTIIYTLNAPLAITLSMVKNTSPLVRLAVTLALDAVTEGFFIRRSIKQLLFAGYNDRLTTIGSLLNPEMPQTLNGKFAYFFDKNNTDDGDYNVYTGTDGNINLVNTINTYNGKKLLKYWSSDECNSLEGTTKGELRPPLPEGINIIKMFSSEICRVINLQYNDTHKLANGVFAKRFILDKNTFKNSTDYPPNSCYIRPVRTNPIPVLLGRQSLYFQNTFYSGVFDMSACKYGAPIFLSQPHFLDADNYYLTTIDGLKPNNSIHSFWIDIEPLTGTTLQVSARFQLNIAINTGQSSLRYRHIPDIIFPIMWQEYSSQVTQEIVDKMLLAQKLPYLIPTVIFYLLLGIGVVIILIALISHVFIVTRKEIINAANTSQLAKCIANLKSNSFVITPIGPLKHIKSQKSEKENVATINITKSFVERKV